MIVASISIVDAVNQITLELRPEGAPEKSGFVPEKGLATVKVAGLKRLSHVSKSMLTVCLPAQPNGKAAARDAGKLRIEGKEYVVADGDGIEFRFNV